MMVATVGPEDQQANDHVRIAPGYLRGHLSVTVRKTKSIMLMHLVVPAMSMDTVQKYLDIPVDHYISINMAGLKELVDAVERH